MLPPTIDLLCKIIYINLIIKFVVATANEWNLPLEYSVGDASYIQFGSVQVKSMFNELSAQFIPTSTEKMESLKNALMASAGAEPRNYRIRSGQVFSTNSVENFIHSKLAHLIELTVDLDQQQLLSITHFPVNKGMNVSNLQGGNQSPIQIYTRIKGADNLPVPDTAAYLHRLEEEKRARQHGATQDNRSFLQKYWMYFIPVVLFVILSNAFNPEQGAE